MKFIGLIPARYASTRFPGKPLALLAGKPVIQHVYEQASKVLDAVYVATDDERIYNKPVIIENSEKFSFKSFKTGLEDYMKNKI